MRIFLTVFTLLLQFLSFSPAAVAAETVTLQLKWEHAFQFAGYYAAVEQGYYQQAGLNVQLKPADPGVDLIDEVVSGRAQYGVGMSGLLLARKAGKPVVVLAVIFQHSPLVLIARKKTAAQSIHDLSNKAILIEPLAEELRAYLKREGVAPGGVQPMIHRFKSEDLISGKADAISAYLSNEPFQLDQARIEYQIYTPRSAGIDFYGDNLFTSESEIKLHPDRVKAFRAASLRGWEYAMNHRDEMIRLIIKKYAPEHGTAQFQFEAEQMASLMRTDLVAVGYMNPGRWRHIADTYAEIGMLPANFSLKGFIYEPDPKTDLTWFYLMLAAAAGLFSIIAAIALYIHRINGRLASTLAEVKKTELRLKVFSTAIEQSPTPVLITGPDSVIQYVNPKFTEETGYSAAEAIGKTPKFLQSGCTNELVYQEMWTRLARGKRWSGELVNRRKSGEIYWEEAHIGPVRDTHGVITHYVAVLLDIDERKHIHAQLAHSAHYDMLTSLPNRSLLFERINQSLSYAKRNQTQLALLFIDLDKFKPINDAYGHAMGDLVLQEAARRMSGCLRDSDTVGRIGGDEFVVLLPVVSNESDASSVAEKIRYALNQPFMIENINLSISSCIGIALYPDHGDDVIKLAKNADFAMYQAKSSGGNKVHIFIERN